VCDHDRVNPPGLILRPVIQVSKWTLFLQPRKLPSLQRSGRSEREAISERNQKLWTNCRNRCVGPTSVSGPVYGASKREVSAGFLSRPPCNRAVRLRSLGEWQLYSAGQKRGFPLTGLNLGQLGRALVNHGRFRRPPNPARGGIEFDGGGNFLFHWEKKTKFCFRSFFFLRGEVSESGKTGRKAIPARIPGTRA